jgi:hypothetical protein
MRLRRILLDAVGHADARFDPLLLDFRGQTGEALDTVLWLRNAGGKTSLLSLIFSVIQPNKGLFLGYLQKGRVKSIDRYVLPDDVSHVVLEWEGESGLPGLARPFITGVVMSQRQGAGGEDSLDRFFYGLTAIDGAFQLEDLPLREGTRRTPYRRYRQLLEEIAVQQPATDLVVREHQGDWMNYLERNGLDPEIFRYQLHMNRDEGGAVELLRRFSDADTFIDFLVDVVSNPQDAAEVADNLAQVADKIEQRPKKEKERQFVAGAVERLRPLAEAHAVWAQVRDQHTQVLLDGSRLRRRITLAAEAAAMRTAERSQEADKQKGIYEEAERLRSNCDRQANALRLEVLRFDVEEKEKATGAARAMEDEARALTRAWQATDIVAELNEAEAKLSALRTALSRAEEDASGLRADYEGAAMRLRIWLEKMVEHENQRATNAKEMAEVSRRRREEAEKRDAEARTRVAEIAIELRQLDEKVGDVKSKLEALHREGLAKRDESASRALERVRTLDTEMALSLETIPGRRTEQESIRDAAFKLVGEIGERLSELRARHEHDRREVEALEQRAREINEHERVLELMGHESLDVFVGGSSLSEHLISAIADAEHRLVDTQVEALEDRRALQAIEEMGLLPAALAIEQAVARLREEKLSATTGWQFLAQNMPRNSWPRLLESAPHLLDAVVVQPGSLERAADVLRSTSIASLTANLVVVESNEFESFAPNGHRLWVLPPATARYDLDAGSAERDEREARVGRVNERADALTRRRDLDRDLLTRVRQLLAGCPPGHLDDLRFTLEGQVQEITRLTASVEAEKERARFARSEVSALDAEERRLGKERISVGRVLSRLEHVAKSEAEQGEWLEAQVSLSGERTTKLDEQGKARLEAEDARSAEDRWKADGNQARNDAMGWLKEIGELPRFEVELEAHDDGSLDRLRADYVSLRDQYERRTSKSQLAKDVDSEGLRAGRIHARLNPYGDVEQKARQLLAAPGAESPGHRAARLDAALQEQEEATELRVKAQSEQEQARNQHEELARDRQHLTTLSDDMKPRDRHQAQARCEEMTAATVAARARREVADNARLEAAEHAKDARHEHDLLASEQSHLAQMLGEQAVESQASYDPILAVEAKHAVEKVVGDLRVAATAVGEEEDRIRRRSGDLRQFALRAAFEEIEAPHRDRLTEADDHVLARRAEGDLEEFERRLPFLEHQLQEIEKHQARVTEQLLVLADDALQNLKWLQRQELPTGLGQWTNQHFFQIRYEIPETHEERRLRVQVLLDEVVNSKRKLGGTALVQQALRAINRRQHFEVSVLKPNEGLRPERASVAEIGAWSGGQKLTTAILIYCALARLRADNRTTKGSSGVGVLLLDNPIGTANLSTLIDLQRLVAQQFGVQLIYTTGLDDKPALAPFTNVIRLGNRRERKRDRGHIVQEDLDQEMKGVDAARIFRKPAASG